MSYNNIVACLYTQCVYSLSHHWSERPFQGYLDLISGIRAITHGALRLRRCGACTASYITKNLTNTNYYLCGSAIDEVGTPCRRIATQRHPPTKHILIFHPEWNKTRLLRSIVVNRLASVPLRQARRTNAALHCDAAPYQSCDIDTASQGAV